MGHLRRFHVVAFGCAVASAAREAAGSPLACVGVASRATRGIGRLLIVIDDLVRLEELVLGQKGQVGR